MNFEQQLLFFFSALGAFNSSLLSLYFFVLARPKHASNYFLGALLLALSIRIWKSIFFYFNPELSKIYLQIGLTACFFIGPFLYFYTKSKLSKPFHKRYMYSQFVVLLLLVFFVGIKYPYETYPELWGNLFYKIINFQWLVYMVATSFVLKSSFKSLIMKSARITKDELWALSVFIGVFLIWSAYFFASYTSYLMGAISFSLVFYLSLLLIYYNNNKGGWSFVKKNKYVGNKISEVDAQKLIVGIDQVLKNQGLYKNPDLTLSHLAEKLKVRPHLISQLLNDNLNKNFSLFINEYRIAEAKRILDSNNKLKMEVVAEMSGFNSNSTFYTAFKKISKTTPARYASS